MFFSSGNGQKRKSVAIFCWCICWLLNFYGKNGKSTHFFRKIWIFQILCKDCGRHVHIAFHNKDYRLVHMEHRIGGPLPQKKNWNDKIHYKISQFYRQKNSVGVWLEVRRWFFYRRHHRRITFVGFPFVGDSPFRRYIGRKNKKTICRWFYRRNLRAKKKDSRLKYTDGCLVCRYIVIDRRKITVGKSVGECVKYQ